MTFNYKFNYKSYEKTNNIPIYYCFFTYKQ